VVVDKMRKSSASESSNQREEALPSSDNDGDIFFVEEVPVPKRSPEATSGNMVNSN
jgi:hypothetical protein